MGKKMKLKAMITDGNASEYEAVVYVANSWRIFGTPFSKSNNGVKVFKSEKSARHGADTAASALGITLVWEK